MSGHDTVDRAPSYADLADPGLRPWPGFALAAQAAVEQLHAAVGLDLWLVTHVSGDEQTIVAAAGPWADLVPPGTVVGWQQSFCLPMVLGRAPMVAPRVQDVEAYAEVARGPYADVRSYLGVPLLTTDSALFGTLCALAGSEQREQLHDSLAPVHLMGRLLSTVLAREQDAHDRSQDAARAYAYAERDALTGLRNRRGWQSALAQESDRCRRYGWPATVLAIGLDDLAQTTLREGPAAGDALLSACSAAVQSMARPGDVVARTGAGHDFAVLALHCDALAARALALRMRVRLRAAGLAASVGDATRRPGEDLAATSVRADAAMLRRRQRRPATTGAVPPLGGQAG